MEQHIITTQQGWLVFVFMIFLNVFAFIVGLMPQKMVFLQQFSPKERNLFGRAYLTVCLIIDTMLVYLTMTDGYPFN